MITMQEYLIQPSENQNRTNGISVDETIDLSPYQKHKKIEEELNSQKEEIFVISQNLINHEDDDEVHMVNRRAKVRVLQANGKFRESYLNNSRTRREKLNKIRFEIPINRRKPVEAFIRKFNGNRETRKEISQSKKKMLHLQQHSTLMNMWRNVNQQQLKQRGTKFFPLGNGKIWKKKQILNSDYIKEKSQGKSLMQGQNMKKQRFYAFKNSIKPKGEQLFQ